MAVLILNIKGFRYIYTKENAQSSEESKVFDYLSEEIVGYFFDNCVLGLFSLYLMFAMLNFQYDQSVCQQANFNFLFNFIVVIWLEDHEVAACSD